MSYDNIIFEKNEKIAKITLNRPDKLNALNKKIFDELNNACSEIELDSEIRVLIITGSGNKAFAAGADIKELHQSDRLSGKQFSEHGSKVMARIESLRIPVIAAVNGFALGGGCELSMCCHLRFASKNAKFGQPEVNLGIIPGYGGTQRLTNLVGFAKSLELNLLGDPISADEAKSIGLVNDVFEQDELYKEVEIIAEKLAAKAPVAVEGIIESVKASTKLSSKDGLEFESIKFGDVCGTKDFKEGTLAFLEKRKPNFIGE